MRLNERSNDTILDKNNSQATDRLSAYNMSSTKNPGTTTSSLFQVVTQKDVFSKQHNLSSKKGSAVKDSANKSNYLRYNERQSINPMHQRESIGGFTLKNLNVPQFSEQPFNNNNRNIPMQGDSI